MCVFKLLRYRCESIWYYMIISMSFEQVPALVFNWNSLNYFHTGRCDDAMYMLPLVYSRQNT